MWDSLQPLPSFSDSKGNKREAGGRGKKEGVFQICRFPLLSQEGLKQRTLCSQCYKKFRAQTRDEGWAVCPVNLPCYLHSVRLLGSVSGGQQERVSSFSWQLCTEQGL